MTKRSPMCTEYLFSEDEWIRVQQGLVCVEAAMRRVVDTHGGHVLGDVRGGYPARRFVRREGLAVAEFRVVLDPKFFEGHAIEYAVTISRWLGIGSVRLLNLASARLGSITLEGACDGRSVSEMLRSAGVWTKVR